LELEDGKNLGLKSKELIETNENSSSAKQQVLIY
jgi:hypothetical protein